MAECAGTLPAFNKQNLRSCRVNKKEMAAERDVAARLPDVKDAIQDGNAAQLDAVVADLA